MKNKLTGGPDGVDHKAYRDTTQAIGELFKMRMVEFQKSGAKPVGIPGQNRQ
jgi:hypothetical protein